MRSNLSEKEGFAALVLRLRADGVSDKQMLLAVEQTPRSLFAPPAFVDQAYAPRTIPIECGESMEGADLALKMLHLLELEPGQRVLEVGTGSGFTAAVISRIVERVVTIDRYRTLSKLAAQRFSHLGFSNIVVETRDGQERSAQEGTFDRILVTAAFEEMPRTFAERLVSGGKLIAAIGSPDQPQMLVKLTKIGSRFEREDLFPVRFQPLLPGCAAVL
ncbi:protein-L-isoaspartate(D-aspartate) O-methyltransferase [Hoeflea prorocentri]|uniref:Protein-L-isoaspartate O-methyltransferase n=1 Tax=Hoeflea prorocentri TaxID=1922333 RepID=A0A9X3UH72_9HYPH|nr:protein-L-isoaspartate(D-aspartate) O-methyltransferase [Hoeflea prorocentri]MCY6380589.1 protein-L-isoaspartate(D-aspartate) O-methyltransferase [Hoeflea prorocentri]MDA5398389.1 protein-L-isoaspartate(D-aspartate) O-methyltransferase [Hoeflea prorocentri]